MEKCHRISVDGLYLNMDLDVGAGTFTSVTGYRKQKSRLPSPYPNQAPVAADGEVLSLFDATRDDDRTPKQQERRVASDFCGSFNFVADGFYQKASTYFSVAQTLCFPALVPPPLPFAKRDNHP